LLVVGLLVFFLNRGGGGDGAGAPAAHVPVDPKAVAAAGAFVQDAVLRRNPARAYEEVTPELRHGTTRADWRSGNIPVVPFPGKQVDVAPFAVKTSVRGRAVLVVELSGPGTKPTAFRIGLQRRGRRWLVDGWTPSGAVRAGS
jgi:hypothetical protein